MNYEKSMVVEVPKGCKSVKVTVSLFDADCEPKSVVGCEIVQSYSNTFQVQIVPWEKAQS